MAILYKVGEEPVEVKPEGKWFELSELQKHVGGYVEFIYAKDGSGDFFVVNEEGRLYNLPPNPTASELVNKCTWVSDAIVGPMLHVLAAEMEPEEEQSEGPAGSGY